MHQVLNLVTKLISILLLLLFIASSIIVGQPETYKEFVIFCEGKVRGQKHVIHISVRAIHDGLPLKWCELFMMVCPLSFQDAVECKNKRFCRTSNDTCKRHLLLERQEVSVTGGSQLLSFTAQFGFLILPAILKACIALAMWLMGSGVMMEPDSRSLTAGFSLCGVEVYPEMEGEGQQNVVTGESRPRWGTSWVQSLTATSCPQ